MPKHKCVVCDGTGTKGIMVYVYGAPEEEATESQIPCIDCNGTGEVNLTEKEQLDRFETMASIWCNCGNPSSESEYHPDSADMKHHWTCKDCAKILQIG